MIRLELDPTQGQVLRLVLENYLSELGTEISHTDARDYRDKLKARRRVLRDVVAELQAQQPE